MKEIKILILVLFTVTGLQAQWNTSGSTIFNTNSGNVGVGTSTPSEKLSVIGTITSHGAIKLKDYLLFDNDGDFTGGNYYTIADDGSGNFLRFGYQFRNDFILNSSGNVGIGTTTPSSPLDIKRVVSDGDLIVLGIDNTNPKRVTLGTSAWSGVIGLYNGSSNQTIKINGGGSSYFNGGNIGIGTTSPTSALDIKKFFSSSADYITIGLDESTNPKRVTLGISTWHGVMGLFNSSNTQTVMVNSGGVSYFNGGNVGIGTTNTFGYKLAVNGTIGAKEVNVEVTSAWPDYVFTPSYNLLSLEEVKRHIEEKGHLPNVPSAADVEENGIELGAMNAKLLEKIEELTLYMIELKEENGELRNRIEKLEKK